MADLIQKTDTLNDGREKLNEAIKDADMAMVDASTAKSTANQALAKSTDTQTQLDTIVIEGDSSVEAAQARVDTKGNPHTTLKARLDSEQTAVASQLAETETVIENVKHLEGFETLNRRRGAQPLITFRDDDGSRPVIDTLKPIFTAEGVPLTVAIPIVANKLTVAEMLDLQNNYGWEFLSHTYNHVSLTDVTDEVLDYELSASKEWLNSRGIKCESIAIPYGNFNDKVLIHCRKYYRGITYSRVSGRNSIPIESALKVVELVEAKDLDPESGFNRNTLEHYKFQVDKAIEEKSWVVFMSHSYAYDDVQKGYLQQLIQYIKSKNVDIVTMNEGLNRMGNIVETGLFFKYGTPKPHFVVGADGSYRSNNKVYLHAPRVQANSYDAYPHDTISVVALTKNEAVAFGFPESLAGTLTTEKVGSTIDGNFTRQKFRIYGTNREYQRFWDKAAYNWKAWEYINSEQVIVRNDAVTSASLMTDFANGKITHSKILNADATGFPENKGGHLITNRLLGDGGFSYQEYTVVQSASTYKRYWSATNVWGPWMKLTLT